MVSYMSLLDEALLKGDMKLAQKLRNNVVLSERIIAYYCIAILENRISVLKYLKDYVSKNSNTCYNKAIHCGNIEAIELFLSWSWPHSPSLIADAIYATRFDILLKLVENKPANFNNYSLTILFERCERKCLDPTDIVIKIHELLREKKVYIEKDQIALTDAFRFGSLKLVKFLYEYGYPTSEEHYKVCMKDISLLKYLYEEMGIRRNDTIPIEYASRAGNIECFEYLLEKGFPMNAESRAEVLFTDHLHMIKYYHEKGYEWDDEVYPDDLKSSVIRQYCHDNNIPHKWSCLPSCYYCAAARVNELKEVWEMDTNEYDSVFQWLPREVADDIYMLVQKGFETIFDPIEDTSEEDYQSYDEESSDDYY